MSKKFEQRIEKEWDKLMWNREYKKGEKLIKEALKIEPNNPKFWYFLGYIYDHMPGKENERKAIECYKKVKSLAPDWVNWRLGMARVYWRKGSLRGLRYYREILKSKLSLVEKSLAMIGMGIAYYQAKKFPQAEKWFLKALKFLPKLKPKHPEIDKLGIFFRLTFLYKDWRKKKEARKYAKKALSLFRFLPSKHRNSKGGEELLKTIKEIAEGTKARSKIVHKKK